MLVTLWPIVPAPDDDDECGAVGGIRIGKGNQSTQCHFGHHKSYMT
jgi:hypothetical protein